MQRAEFQKACSVLGLLCAPLSPLACGIAKGIMCFEFFGFCPGKQARTMYIKSMSPPLSNYSLLFRTARESLLRSRLSSLSYKPILTSPRVPFTVPPKNFSCAFHGHKPLSYPGKCELDLRKDRLHPPLAYLPASSCVSACLFSASFQPSSTSSVFRTADFKEGQSSSRSSPAPLPPVNSVGVSYSLG